MKAVMMLAMLAVAVAAPHGEDKLRRFLPGTINIVSALNNAITTYKHAFTSIVTAAGYAINIDHVIQLISPLLDSKTSQAVCKAVCMAEDSLLGLHVLGSKLSPACDQVCHAALAEIELKLFTSGR